MKVKELIFELSKLSQEAEVGLVLEPGGDCPVEVKRLDLADGYGFYSDCVIIIGDNNGT